MTTQQFQEYMLAHNDVTEDEDQLVGRCLGRLQRSLRKVMFVCPCYTLTEAILHTTAIKESHTIEIPQSWASMPQTAKDEVRSKKYRQLLKEDNTIGSSTRPTQMGQQAPNADGKGQGKATIHCFKCNKLCYISSDCRKRAIHIVQKGEESDDPSSYAADDDQPKIDDSGAMTILFMMMIHKILLSPKVGIKRFRCDQPMCKISCPSNYPNSLIHGT